MYTYRRTLVNVFLLWSLCARVKCGSDVSKTAALADVTSIRPNNTFTSGSNTSGEVVYLRSANGNRTFRIHLTSTKELKLENGSTLVQLWSGHSDTVNGKRIAIPPGVYFTNNSRYQPDSFLEESKPIVNETQTVQSNVEESSTLESTTDASILDDWNLRNDASLLDQPSHREKRWPIHFNVTNCTADAYENEVSIVCHDVQIVPVALELPKNTTILKITKCSGDHTFLRTPALSHLEKLRVLHLTYCGIRYIKSTFFQGLTNLRTLNLKGNSIMVLGKQIFSNTSNISELNLNSNIIMSVQSLSEAAKNLKKLSQLHLENNKILERILSRDFENLQNSVIDTLTFYDCALSKVEKGSFQYFSHLKTLILSVNPIDREALLNITSGLVSTQLQHLELEEMTSIFRGDGFITKELQPLESTQLTSLVLDSNFIVRLADNDFPRLVHLKKLSLNNCYLDSIYPHAFSKLSQLEELTLTRNRLLSIIFQIPSLRLLDISSNPGLSRPLVEFQISEGSLSSYSKLYVFKLASSTYAGPITENTFSCLYSLQLLSITSTSLNNITDYAFRNLTNLKHLSLSSNSIQQLTGKTFIGLSKLTQLYLNNNLLTYLADTEMFKPLVSLEVLFLRRNQLKHLPPEIFFYNTKLELLLLSHNLITAWQSDVFSPNGSLRVLLLDNNAIEDVTPSMLSTFQNLEELDLSWNVFKCNSCNMKRFQDWILDSGNTTTRNFQERPDTYICNYDNQNVSISNANIPESVCWPPVDNTGTIAVVSVSVCIILILGFTLSVYKLRWYLRYIVFSVRSRVKRYREFKKQKTYRFDAFVSYSSTDVSWVAEVLVPRLEGQEFGFRLCLHDRDFMVGAPITENILESIDSSRKTIMVLTEDYVKSNWCMFELHMAQHRLFEDTRDALILIQLKDVPKGKLPRQLRYVMKTRTYIPWIASEKSVMGNRLFWKKLSEAIKCVDQPQVLNRIT